MNIMKIAGKCAAAILCLALFLVMLQSFVFSTGSQMSPAYDSVSASIMDKFEMFVNNSSSEALDGIVPIKKIYTLSEDLIVAPEPDQSLFGTAAEPAELENVITSASKLLDGQKTVFSNETPLMPGTEINYYLDETILAITWKQVIDNACYTFSEIKIADASQFRRYLADNTFGSSIQYQPSDMAATVNAVVAMNGDFYKFRNMGIIVYQREVYRVEGEDIDTCFIDSNGDLNFVKRGEILERSEAERYVEDKDILFSLSFGPILVDNGVAVATSKYPIGEVDQQYSRSAIAQLGELHYLLVAVSFDGPYRSAASITQLAAALEEIGCDKAYTLDGGQTATVIMNDTVINHVDFGYQRNISDIIYFATALPERKVTQ